MDLLNTGCTECVRQRRLSSGPIASKYPVEVIAHVHTSLELTAGGVNHQLSDEDIAKADRRTLTGIVQARNSFLAVHEFAVGMTSLPPATHIRVIICGHTENVSLLRQVAA